jgi:hypothetical protein
MSLARTYLRILGAMTLLFGLIYLFFPQSMTDPTGFGALGPSATTDVRATYGGLQIGLGLFLLWAAAQEARVRLALVLQVLTIGAVASSRALGIVLDGEASGVLVGALAFEILLTIVSIAVLRRLPHAMPSGA